MVMLVYQRVSSGSILIYQRVIGDIPGFVTDQPGASSNTARRLRAEGERHAFQVRRRSSPKCVNRGELGICQ